MHLKVRNVNEAFRVLVGGIHEGSIPTGSKPSRVGSVLQVLEPVILTYTHPRERVLFNQSRDCNHIFHAFESLWMLAGRNDVAPLAHYNSRMADFSDDGKTFHGAYGYRWRNAYDYYVNTVGGLSNVNQGGDERFDQLNQIAENLKKDPNSRREVLQIWDWRDDLAERPEGALDLPCNTHAYFSIREKNEQITIVDKFQGGIDVGGTDSGFNHALDMTVCNRSNDLIWGMLGANVVHFSFLLEYMAACIGVEVGVYNQFTNNLHVYTERWKPEEWLADREPDHYTKQDSFCSTLGSPYSVGNVVPLVRDPEQFDQEVDSFVEFHSQNRTHVGHTWEEPFLETVASPMCMAFHHYKNKDFGDALNAIDHVQSDDWRIVGRNWIKKRAERHEDRNQYSAKEREELNGRI